MEKKEKEFNLWKGVSLILAAFVLFLIIADVSVSPRFIQGNESAEQAKQQEESRQEVTRQPSSRPSSGGMVGGC